MKTVPFAASPASELGGNRLHPAKPSVSNSAWSAEEVDARAPHLRDDHAAMAAAEPVAPAANAWQKPLFEGRKSEEVVAAAPPAAMASVGTAQAEVHTPPPVRNAWSRASASGSRVGGDWGPTLQEANKLSPAEKRELRLQQLKRQETEATELAPGAASSTSGSSVSSKGKKKEGKGKKKGEKSDKDKNVSGRSKKNRRNKSAAANKHGHVMPTSAAINPAFAMTTGIGAGSLAFPPGMPGIPGMPPMPPMPFYAAYGPAGVFVPASSENRTMYAASAVRAIEMTFSPNHLCTDEFLRQHMDVEGFVPVALVANYTHVAQFGALYEDLLAGLANSEILQLDVENETVRLRENWEQWLFPDGKGGMGCPRYVKVSPMPSTDAAQDTNLNNGEEDTKEEASNGSKKTEEASADSGDSCDGSESSSNGSADPVVS